MAFKWYSKVCAMKYAEPPSPKKSLELVYMERIAPGYLCRYSCGLPAERPGFDFRQGQEIFLFSTASILL
jgi:hypothetical protein